MADLASPWDRPPELRWVTVRDCHMLPPRRYFGHEALNDRCERRHWLKCLTVRRTGYASPETGQAERPLRQHQSTPAPSLSMNSTQLAR